VRAWLHSPGADPLGCVVELIGYGGGRGLALERLTWAAAGWAHLIVDTRGQGSSWSVGDTPDVERDGGNPQHPGFMTRGVRDPRTYYYRRLIADAVRAVEAARELTQPARLVLRGSSQGGGVALAAAALAPGVDGLLADVPFLCHFRRGIELTDEDPYAEVARYLRVHRDHTAEVFRTLSYVDGVNFAARASVPALFSVALMDEICPPSTVYAAYNRYAGPKEIVVYEFNRHEGGEAHQLARQLEWVSR
jgi:cephalosporin-C deacetylase